MNAEGEGVFYAGRCAAVGGVCNLNESSPLASTVTCQTGRPSLPPPPQSFSLFRCKPDSRVTFGQSSGGLVNDIGLNISEIAFMTMRILI